MMTHSILQRCHFTVLQCMIKVSALALASKKKVLHLFSELAVSKANFLVAVPTTAFEFPPLCYQCLLPDRAVMRLKVSL